MTIETLLMTKCKKGLIIPEKSIYMERRKNKLIMKEETRPWKRLIAQRVQKV